MPTSLYAYPLGVPIFRWFDQNGDPAASWQLATYVAGTSTPLATYPTYVDALAGTNANTNPVVLDGNGAAQVWVQATSYKMVMMLPVAQGSAVVYTQDNVAVAIGFPGSFLDQWVREQNAFLFATPTSFTVTGLDVTGIYTTGRRVKTVNTGGTVYSTVTSSSFAANTTVNLANDSGSLDAGLSQVNYGLISKNNPGYLDPGTSFTARLTANQTGFAASTKLAGWTVERDALSEWVAGSNRLVFSHPGDYLVVLQAEYADTGTNVDVTLQISRSGSVVAQSRTRTSATASQVWCVTCSTIVNVTNTSTYVEGFFLGTANTTIQGTIGTRLTVTRLPTAGN